MAPKKATSKKVRKAEEEQLTCLKCAKCRYDLNPENLDVNGFPTMVYCDEQPILRMEEGGTPHYQRQVITQTKVCKMFHQITTQS